MEVFTERQSSLFRAKTTWPVFKLPCPNDKYIAKMQIEELKVELSWTLITASGLRRHKKIDDISGHPLLRFTVNWWRKTPKSVRTCKSNKCTKIKLKEVENYNVIVDLKMNVSVRWFFQLYILHRKVPTMCRCWQSLHILEKQQKRNRFYFLFFCRRDFVAATLVFVTFGILLLSKAAAWGERCPNSPWYAILWVFLPHVWCSHYF